MEAGYKGFRINFRNLILALIFLGILMLVIAFLLSPDKNEQILDFLRTFGALFILMGFLIIILPILIKEMAKLNR